MNIIKYNQKNYFKILNVCNFLKLIKNKDNLLFKNILEKEDYQTLMIGLWIHLGRV